jgi:hypothetical protein
MWSCAVSRGCTVPAAAKSGAAAVANLALERTTAHPRFFQELDRNKASRRGRVDEFFSCRPSELVPPQRT